MSLKSEFRQAEKIISNLSPDELNKLKEICLKIREAQEGLQKKSKGLMTRCIQGCGGICCRNLQLDLIINHYDFVFIMVMNPSLKEKMEASLENEKPFFTSDCIFLENGVGPCMFPPDSRPEVCIVTFCDDLSPIKREIAEVRRKFFNLTWFFATRKPRAIMRWIAKFY